MSSSVPKMEARKLAILEYCYRGKMSARDEWILMGDLADVLQLAGRLDEVSRLIGRFGKNEESTSLWWSRGIPKGARKRSGNFGKV